MRFKTESIEVCLLVIHFSSNRPPVGKGPALHPQGGRPLDRELNVACYQIFFGQQVEIPPIGFSGGGV